jgi:hypothetical protein
MSASENVKVRITDVTGINMSLLNVYNMALCTENFDGANKEYVTSHIYTFTNIGIGASSYKNTSSSIPTTVLMRSIFTNILTSYPNVTNLNINTDMFYMPYLNGVDISAMSSFQSTDGSWDSSVLAPNGNIYCIPLAQTYVLIINPYTNTLDSTTITFASGFSGWYSSTLAQDGKIYCPPGLGSTILIIDPLTNIIDTTSITVTGMNNNGKKYKGICCGPNGKLYCPPRSETRVLIIDTINKTTTTIAFSSGGTLTDKYLSCICGQNGKIYCPPFDFLTTILKIDTATNIIDNTSMGIGFFSGGSFQGCCLAQDGKIYCSPYGYTKILIIDPLVDSVDTTTMQVPNTTGAISGFYPVPVLAPDGKIYCSPRSCTNVLILDPDLKTSDTTTLLIPSSLGINKYTSGTLSSNGKIYCPPFRTSAILIIPTGPAVINLRQCVSTYNNKS